MSARIALLALALSNLTACTVRVVDFTAISTKNVAVAGEQGPRIKGKDCGFFVAPSMKEAIDDALEKAGPGYDMLVDGVVYQSNNFLLCYKIEGTPVKSKGGAQ